MKKFSFLFFLLLSCIGISSLYSQTLDQWINAADESFQKKDYYSAFKYYDVAIKYDTSRIDLWYKLGESAQLFTAYNAARDAYRIVNSSSLRDSFPLLDYRMAEVLQKKGLYTEAASLYDTYISHGDTLLEEAEKHLINCDWAADALTRPANTFVHNMGDQINSPYSDFGLFHKNDTIYFSSLRFYMKDDEVIPRREVSKILRQDEPDGKIKELPGAINQDGRIAAHTAYNHESTVVYYTLCDYIGTTSDFRCEIYSSTIEKNGKWGTPKRLALNDAAATNTQPSVGMNLKTGVEYIYFASNRAGGMGGLDIYRSELLADGNCGPVQALDGINTKDDDATPFYYSPTQTLYFSTNGRLTMGGFDTYRASERMDGWDRPVNMGVPINSSYNDQHYVRFEQEEHAYFSSNRPDSLALFWDDTKDACCFDIYKVGITDEIKLLALTFNELNNNKLPLASVALYDITDGRRRLLDSIYNPTDNDFNFIVVPGKKYELVGTKPGYSIATEIVDLTDPNFVPDGRIEKQLYLAPGIKLDIFTFNELDSTTLAGTTAFLYELAPDGEIILLDSIVNPRSNDFHFVLDFDKKYQVFTRKDGYTPAMTFIDTHDPELARQGTIHRDLYMKPGLVLEVYSWRARDHSPLAGATVFLYEYSNTQGEVLVDSITNIFGHQTWFEVEKGKNYVLRGERPGFGPTEDSLDLTGDNIPETGTFRRDLLFKQLLEIYTFDAETELKLPGAEVTISDPHTGEIIAERINPSGNKFRFAVALDRPYKLDITRKGYTPVSDIITFSDEDLAEGNGKIVLDVYMDPLKGPGSMLPLYLYFDNDHPNPRSTSTTTSLEYVETNVEYYQKKQEFIQNFTAGAPLEEAFRLRRRFTDFFNREVRGGRYDLEEFAKRLLEYLAAGNRFTLDLKGFASPRSNAVYNKILSERRINSVVNFLEEYDNEALMPYINSNQLSFTKLPLGETQADPKVIDRLDDKKNSIYDVFASLERRVEIRSSEENN